ncbi:MAG: molecular chaperone TorD family protein [Thermodesulfovibrionia bacterium]
MMEDYIKENQLRAECYRLLSACYCKPTKEFIEEGLINELITVLKPICPEALPYAEEMLKGLLDSELLNSPIVNSILIDYSRLFIGPFKLVAPPYGSVYLDKEGLLMGDSTIEAVRLYREAGVEMDRDTHKDMPDHISVELEFMYYLIFKEIESIERGDRESAKRYENLRKDFLKRHLCAWAFKFLNSLKNGAETTFYKNLALCTETFLKQDSLRELAIEV